MKYVGLDVHVKATVWCCLDGEGQVVERGKVATTVADLVGLAERLGSPDEVMFGQEAGKMSYFVHDTLMEAGRRLLTFNAHHLRMIAASRKKTDRRDAFWIAKALQTGMMPHPVFIPTGEVRQLRGLLAQREALVSDRTGWLIRAKTLLAAAGAPAMPTRGSQSRLERALARPDGLDALTADRVEQCQRMHLALTAELAQVDARIHELAKNNDEIKRLQTIPAVGERVAVTVHAWVGDVRRFPTARALAAYAGLVPSVHQSAETSSRREASPWTVNHQALDASAARMRSSGVWLPSLTVFVASRSAGAMRTRLLCGIFVAVAGTGWALGCGDDNSGEEPAGTGGAGGASGSDAGDAAGTGGTGALGGSDGAAGADGSAPTNLGAACTADSDCTSGLVCVKKGVSKFTQAIPGEFYPPHGMCSAECTTDAECSALVKGAVCKPGYNSTTVTKFCHEPCTRGEQSVWPSLSPEKCHGRADVACTSEGYCRPTCGSPADCESGDGCHYMYGLCRTGDLSEIDVDWGGPPKCKTSSTASVPDPSADAGQYYYCTGKCTHGSPTACGNAATATKAIAGCFLAEPGAPMGAGDRGGCARLCDCDADCAGPTVCLALFPAAVTQLGRYGYCWSATASDPGKPCASDAGTD